MKILKILECAAQDDVAIHREIGDPLVRELDDFVQATGVHLSNYLATDEVAIARCIIATARQAENYRASAMVEKIIRYIFSKAALAKAVA